MTDSLDSSAPVGYRVGDLGEWCSLPWPDDPVEKKWLFEHSLGPGVIDWAEWRTDEPGLLNDEGEPWRFTDGQARFLILWYAYDENGRFIYRTGARRGAKGTGKDPFGAAMCNIELLGPCQLYWDEDLGRWNGKRRTFPLVQMVSNSEAQSKSMLRVANSQLGSEAVGYYQLDKGQTATYIHGGGARMEVLTASEKSAEGAPATFIALNETHHMTESSGGMKMADVIQRNVAKSKSSSQARFVEFTNAHVEGMDSVAERTYIAWQAQQSNPKLPQDMLYDSIEADPKLDFYDAEQRELAIRQAYSDAPWSDIERLCSEILDRRLSAAQAIRFYLNGVAAAEDSFVEPQAFAALSDQSKRFDDGDRVVMFLDCSKSEDATALMGCRIDDGFVQTLGVWQRPRGKRGEGYLVDRAEVDLVVREAFDRFKVVWFGVDPSPAKDDSTEASYWRPVIDSWHRDFHRRLRVHASPGHSVMFDMRLSDRGGAARNKQFSEETEMLRDAIDVEGLDGEFRHDGHSMLIAHTNNARARLNKFGLVVGKASRDSGMNVDACVAMIGARLGRRLALNSGKVKVRRRRGGGTSGRVHILR